MEKKYNSVAYVRANKFIEKMRLYKRNITRQEFKTLRGQALSGDIEGAEKGLKRLILRGYAQ